MLIEYDKINKVKTIKFDKFLKYEYKLLKKIIREILLYNDYFFETINFDIYHICDYKYFYIIKLIKFFYDNGNNFRKKTNNINIYSSNKNKQIYDYIFTLITKDELPDKLKINFIEQEINWNKTKSTNNIIFKKHINNNLENNFVII